MICKNAWYFNKSDYLLFKMLRTSECMNECCCDNVDGYKLSSFICVSFLHGAQYTHFHGAMARTTEKCVSSHDLFIQAYFVKRFF